MEYDWAKSVYGEVREEIPMDIPSPLGKHVMLSHFVDANLMHNLITGRSVMGCMHLINKMPLDWYAKKQATMETATYSSEFVAACMCTEQIIELHTLLHFMGIPVHERSYMFGYNGLFSIVLLKSIPSYTSTT